MAKVLMINGSPRANGNTSMALQEMKQVFDTAGMETEVIMVGNKSIQGCVACNHCGKTGEGCIFDDEVNVIAEKFKEADALVVASPVYYASANGTLISFLDRLFYSTSFSKMMKVGASVAVARRGGLTATYDELNKYFAISGMPIASGQYWNGVHGTAQGEAKEDAEGLQQMRTLANNMVFLIRCIADGKEKYGLPERETPIFTNFVR